MSLHENPESAVDRLAAGQHGLITRRHAEALGLTPRQIDRRLLEGRWIRVARGVYRVAAAPVTWQQNLTAACLAGPPGVVASHFSAAAMYGLWRPPLLPHVTVPPAASARLPIAKVHRALLAPEDVAVVGLVRVTRPARLIVECAPLLGQRQLASLVDDAFCRSLTHVAGVEAALARVGSPRGRKGAARVREALAAWGPGIDPGSPAEMRLVRRLREWGFPEPERQIEVFDAEGHFIGRADMGWRALSILVEYDSDRYHNPRQWAKDERRASGFEAAGYTVLHAGKPDLSPGSDRLRWRLDRAFRAARRQAG